MRFKAILGRRALANIRIYKRWAVSPLPKPLVLLTLKDHLLAFDYVLQPVSIKSPKYLQVWEILKNLLALQAGSSAGAGTVCIAPPCVSEDASEDESENESEDEPDAAGGEPEAPEDSMAGQSTVVGHEAAVKGEVVNSRSEFVLVRVPGTLTLPVRRGLDVVGLDVVDNTNGATPLLVGEVKAVAGFERDIWKPLSSALELMQKSPSQQPQSMWVFLTDVHTWDFVRVDRLPCSKGKAGGATAPGTATAPGGATAPGTATAPGGATVGSTTVPNTGTVGGAAAGAAAAGAVPGGTKASGVKYAFQRFKPVFVTTMEAPDDGYLQLLAVLHHIIYPEEQLADLPARVSRSSEALQARAQAWLNGAETPQMRAKEEVAKAEARVAAAAEARAAAEETAAAEARVAAEAEARGQAEAKAKEADEARAAEAEARAVAEAWAAAEAEARAEAEAWAAAEAEAWAAAEVEARAAAQARVAAEARAAAAAEARAAAAAEAAAAAKARVAAEARAAAAAEARAAAAAEAAAAAKARAAAEAKAKEADKAGAAADEARAVA